MGMKTATTAAGNTVLETNDCPFCNRRIGLNGLGRMAKHGHRRGSQGCIASGFSPYGAKLAWAAIVGLTAMGTWARRGGV